jgi:p-cumate 2,3-dioxygenase ferredoxin reductase component
LSARIDNIVIAGAGQAGGRAAEALRARGFQGAITMLGEESHPPYERPQLSKAMLHAPGTPVAYIKQAGDWSDILDVRLETGAAVTDCDLDRRTVSTADGRSFAFDRLLVATGTRPRRLAALENSKVEIQYLRNVEDALRFRKSIQDKSRIAIVGGGVIGLEAACAAAKNGCQVTVIETEQRLLARAFPAVVSDLVAARHRNHGVDFIFGATVTAGAGRRQAQQWHRGQGRPRAGRHWCRTGRDGGATYRTAVGRWNCRRSLRSHGGVRCILRRRRSTAMEPLPRPRDPS